MRVRLTRRAGQPGTKKLAERYGENLLCVRYRYDDETAERLKTVEIVVGRREWRGPVQPRRDDPAPVFFRIAEREELLRRAVLIAGGKWDESTDSWSLPRRAATARGLHTRLIRRRRNMRRS